MSSKKGIIALMGSGELTATMVEVHKELLGSLAQPPQAIFLDTPAGFQLNVDQLSERAAEYFRKHVQQNMLLASFKSRERFTEFEAEQTFHKLRQANFILIGPGSPTYAVRQWQGTSIPEIITRQVEEGGCLVAASAAALTVGRFTLPVYEIYKVGQDLHWVEGVNILEHFGFNLVVIPHWNNAEGGTHDTRFCFMGESRFSKLESMLPEDVSVFGLDEHTACLIDLEKEEAVIKGLGSVCLRRRGEEIVFEKGDRFSLEVLRGGTVGEGIREKVSQPEAAKLTPGSEGESFWDRIHGIEETFRVGLEKHDSKKTTNALLELDRAIWKGKQDLENEEFISQAREVLRDLIVLFGMELETSPKDKAECLAPVMGELLNLRQRFRDNKQWEEADAIRESLERGDVIIEDTEEGPRWRLKS
ncbi:MAG: CysS/YqeB C-terminal domain-containing protein [Syntrophobacteria bacterium]|jgi:peptidase E